MTVPFQAFVDAADGVSTAVARSVADTTVATITPDGLLTARCPVVRGATAVMAMSVADPTRRGTAGVGVLANARECPGG